MKIDRKCSDGGTCVLCGCENPPPYHCMYCLEDFDEETSETISQKLKESGKTVE